MGNILSRIKEIADNESVTISALERTIGASKGVLSRALNNNTDIQAKWIESIVENYPQYSISWLITGEGEMLKGDTQAACSVPSGIRAGIPLIPFNAMAGALRGEQSAMDYECEHYVVPDFRNADFMMHISGDSMVPTFQSGDIVACQRVPMSGLFFQWNRPYILDTDQGAIIKRVKPGSDSSHVLIVSDNREYDAFELEYSQIHAVALVLGIIRLE